jgi:hypothetical protein|tara:strand:- start:3651 stop:4049 length:399 start_codon:yes stop_codon:yes gene_type:complete
MDSKHNIVEIFNNKLTEFINDLLKIHDDSDLLAFRTSINLMVCVDNKKPIRMFHKHIFVPYAERIENKDETFFLEKDYSTDVEVVGKEYVDFNNGLVNKIKQFWSEMESHNKDIVWKYLCLLVLLCNKFYKM